MQHGRAVYEERAPRLLAVAERFGALAYMREEVRSYEAMKALWTVKQLKAQSHALEAGSE
jgi:hypothetical protein